ncbi:MAG: bacteriohemerythrin [Bacteroidales bacterium]|nr:bacteriohemerythrin [Bacteroidales bacterium]
MAVLFMQWRPDFNLGIEEMDNQHKKIVELINTLHEAFLENSTGEILKDIFSELIDYADYHFKAEEALFKKYNFPFAEEHIKMHVHFTEKINSLKKQYEQGVPVTFRVISFMQKWLTNHILDADREYASLVRYRTQ